MGFQYLVVSFLVLTQGRHKRLVKIDPRQNRSERDVQHLPAMEILQQFDQPVVAQTGGVGHFSQFGRDVVGGPVGVIPFAGESHNLTEQPRIDLGHGPQRLQVAGAGGFEMDQIAGLLGGDGIDAEFVGAGVQAEFVRAKGAGDGHVLGKRRLERAQVADVIDALLKGANVAGSQADPLHVEPS